MNNLNGGLSGSGLLKGALGGGGVAPPQDVYWDDILNKPDFATVATSGSYNDLTDKPTIPDAQVNADWNATSGVAEILNKPTLATVATSGSYNDLTDTPTIPPAQVNADWNATSGVAEILNKPTIPAAQVNADWNATSGIAEILNKPTIPTTASQISYDNTTSGLTATDTQEAIDENAAEITTIKSNLIDLTLKSGTLSGTFNPRMEIPNLTVDNKVLLIICTTANYIVLPVYFPSTGKWYASLMNANYTEPSNVQATVKYYYL